MKGKLREKEGERGEEEEEEVKRKAPEKTDVVQWSSTSSQLETKTQEHERLILNQTRRCWCVS